MADMTPMGDLVNKFKFKAEPVASTGISIRMIREYIPTADQMSAGWGAQPDWATCPDAKQERAAIMEDEGNLSRQDAEKAAGVTGVGHATKE